MTMVWHQRMLHEAILHAKDRMTLQYEKATLIVVLLTMTIPGLMTE